MEEWRVRISDEVNLETGEKFVCIRDAATGTKLNQFQTFYGPNRRRDAAIYCEKAGLKIVYNA